jgi:hypothetical protein
MSSDDVLIAITLGGLFLSGSYIRACLREIRRERDFQIRRVKRASIPQRGRPDDPVAPRRREKYPLAGEGSVAASDAPSDHSPKFRGLDASL